MGIFLVIVIGLGAWLIFRKSGPQYWSLGLCLILAAAGFSKRVKESGIIEAGIANAIVMGIVGLAIGGIIDYLRRKKAG